MIYCVDKNDSLSGYFERIEDLQDEINLLVSLALPIELLNIVWNDSIVFYSNLNWIFYILWELNLNFLFESGWEKDELDLILQFIESLNEWV